MTPAEIFVGGLQLGIPWLVQQVEGQQSLALEVYSIAQGEITFWQNAYQSSYSAMRVKYAKDVAAALLPLTGPPPPPPVVVPQSKPYTGSLFEQLTPLQAWYTSLPQGYKPPPPQEAPPLVTIPPPVQEILSKAARILVT